MKNIEIYDDVRKIAECRFYQARASLWILNTRFVQAILVASLAGWICLELLAENSYIYLKTFSLIVFCLSFAINSSRASARTYFVDGYEQGFIDATTRDLGYWDGVTRTELSDEKGIAKVLEEISASENRLPSATKKERHSEIERGISKAKGI